MEERGKVYIKKRCPEHGTMKNLLWSDAATYTEIEKYSLPSSGEVHEKCPMNCTSCGAHKSVPLGFVMDITNRCDLRCPICFANAGAAGYVYEPSMEQIEKMLRVGLESGGEKNIELSGGEPLLRDDLPEIIKLAKSLGFENILVTTNGMRISREPALARELKKAGASAIYLQFDGLTDDIYEKTRGQRLLNEKLQVIEECRKAKLPVFLVPTVVKGLNDMQLGDIIRFAVENSDIIAGINFHTVTFTGRHDNISVEKNRITVPDIAERIKEQTSGRITFQDFYPMSYPNFFMEFYSKYHNKPVTMCGGDAHCGMATVLHCYGDEYLPYTQILDFGKIEKAVKTATEEHSKGIGKITTPVKLLSEIRAGKVMKKKVPGLKYYRNLLKASGSTWARGIDGMSDKNTMIVGIKLFHDHYNLEMDSLSRCTIQYLTPEGMLPFCAYQLFHREGIMERWAKK
jgi:uncharacterized radical SAM superfamily Fe-S cluster-containing enzyme